MTGPSTDPKIQVCAVCGWSLERYTPIAVPGPDEWVHASPLLWDHLPVPVDPDVITANVCCDFCGVEGRTPWLVRCHQFVMGIVGPNTHMSSSHWGACEDCKQLVSMQRWTSLTKKCSKMSAARIGQRHLSPEAVQMLAAMHGRLAANIIDIVPLTDHLAQEESPMREPDDWGV